MQVLSEGQRLKHDVYGMGVVIASDPDRTSIDFDDHGGKLFVTNLMKAELIGEAPPKRLKARRRRAKKTAVAPAMPLAASPEIPLPTNSKAPRRRAAARIKAVPRRTGSHRRNSR